MLSPHYEGLEVEEDMQHERRAWRLQRIGRIGLAVFLVLAFLGFTGSGPLSNASASSEDDALSVSFERFDRINSMSTFEVHYTPELVSEGELQIWLSANFLTNIQLEQIIPEPDSVELDSERYVYTFAVTSLDRPPPVSFHFRPEKPGIARSNVGIVDGPDIAIRQIVFP